MKILVRALKPRLGRIELTNEDMEVLARRSEQLRRKLHKRHQVGRSKNDRWFRVND